MVEIYGNDAGVQRMLEAVDTALNPVAISGFLSEVIDPYLRKEARSRFNTEGDNASGKWAPLADSTQAIRDSMGYGASHPINRREDELYNYVVNTPGGVQTNPLGATLMFPKNYPGGDLGEKLSAAQTGGVGGSGRSFPARKVYALGQDDLYFVLLALASHIERVGGQMI